LIYDINSDVFIGTGPPGKEHKIRLKAFCLNNCHEYSDYSSVAGKVSVKCIIGKNRSGGKL